MEAYYANIINYRVTATELLLEFGLFFPGQSGRAMPNDSDFAAHVVVSSDLLETMVSSFQQAIREREKQRQHLVAQQQLALGEAQPKT